MRRMKNKICDGDLFIYNLFCYTEEKVFVLCDKTVFTVYKVKDISLLQLKSFFLLTKLTTILLTIFFCSVFEGETTLDFHNYLLYPLHTVFTSPL